MAEIWQSWENLFLYEVGGKMPPSLIAEKLERTERAITTQASRLSIRLTSTPPVRKWTQAELFLFGRFSVEEIAQATGRTIPSVRWKLKSLTRASGGKLMAEWSAEELEMLGRNGNNEVVAALTGRTIEEVGDKRLQVNIERCAWDKYDPEREAV